MSVTADEQLLIGSLIDPGGVARAKAVPAARTHEFATSGMGASPSWNVFRADDQLAFTQRFSPAGDMRLRIVAEAARALGDGLSWGPVTAHTLDGDVDPTCSRSVLARTVARLQDAGITASVGHELEFQLFPNAPAPNEGWSAYGLRAVADHATFLQLVLARARTAALDIVQMHAEAGPNQFELSIAPRPPVEAADDLVLARLIVGLAARDTGYGVSFSPLPEAGAAGNGAHQHLSLHADDGPLFSGGDGPYGLTDRGAAAIAGILATLPDIGAVLAGSPLSAERLKPGMWSGATCRWGLEDREATVRLVAATAGTPSGANIEIKPIDASANPYLATALILGGALDGIKRNAPLLPEASDDAPLLPTDTNEQLARLERSPIANRVLGPELVEAITAVRRLEHETWSERGVEERAERFRFTWG
ncbi:type I glutamate--ammonia ligase [Microbacterium sp. GXF7504]